MGFAFYQSLDNIECFSFKDKGLNFLKMSEMRYFLMGVCTISSRVLRKPVYDSSVSLKAAGFSMKVFNKSLN